jgi:iduronate 2-sulfatase
MPDTANVLFISIDDLRPELGCYGCDHIHSPHLDALAAESMVYDRCYCQVPVCGASRASTHTGARPLPDRFVDYFARADEDMPEVAIIPRHLRDHGWHTVSRGKVLHYNEDSPSAWCEPAWRPADSFPGYRDPDNIAFYEEMLRRIAATHQQQPRGPAVEVVHEPEASCPDYQTADTAIADLTRLAKNGRPFFLGAGFLRPHLPFSAPRRYFDLYDRERLPLPVAGERPTDVPAEALHRFPELRIHYTGIPEDDVLPEPLVRELRHGYFASVSFLDAQVGRLLAAVDDLGLRNDTIVVFSVDHGWNLGEHGLWCKHCMYETSLRIPLMLRVPGRTPGRCQNLVDNLDLYPTLCELLDIPPPAHALDGISLVPTLDDPSSPTKNHSFSRYHAGESVRNDRYRYSQWRRDGTVVGRTLFDHASDPGEARNLAENPDHAAIVDELAAVMPR